MSASHDADHMNLAHGEGRMRLTHDEYLVPEWPAPPQVRTLLTLRGRHGASAGPWGRVGGAPGGMNLGTHCGDDPLAVSSNRARLRAALPADPVWLEQVHGIDVFDADAPHPGSSGAAAVPRADAAVSTRTGRPLVILTADCLPVLLCDRQGTVVGAAHAGWRGLAAGVLERTVDALRSRAPGASQWLAWLGPSIGAARFEVGADVVEAFVRDDASASDAFRPGAQAGKWLADLPLLARMRLRRAGVEHVFGEDLCTVSDAERFYSYRRDGVTGRFGTLIWLDAH